MNSATQGSSAVWRTAGGSNARSGILPGTTPGQAGTRGSHRARRLALTLDVPHAVHASPVFDAAGHAFVADLGGGIHAFRPDGTPRWSVRIGAPVSATPVVHPSDTLLYAGTHAGDLVALDLATGAIRWQRALPTRRDPRILSDLLLVPASGLLVLSSWGGRFLALDAGTGGTVFDWEAGISPRAAAAADADGRVYTLRALAGRGIEFVRTEVLPSRTETILHREPEDPRGANRTLVAAAPVLDEARGRAYLILNRERAGRLLAWSLATHAPAWSQPLDAAVQATPTLLPDGSIWIADLAGTLRKFQPDGTPGPRLDLSCDYLLAGGAGTAADGGTLWIGDPLGNLHAIGPGGTARRVMETPRSIQSRPALGPDGHLHVAGSDGRVYRIDPGGAV